MTFTGAECNAWAGGLQGRDSSGGYAIQGNILVGDQVVDQMEDAWLGSPHLPRRGAADARPAGRRPRRW